MKGRGGGGVKRGLTGGVLRKGWRARARARMRCDNNVCIGCGVHGCSVQGSIKLRWCVGKLVVAVVVVVVGLCCTCRQC